MATLTRNLKLRLSNDLSPDSRYNLERLDQLGATFNIDSNNNTVVRAAGDMQFRPEDNSVGGSGEGGTVEFGDLTQRLAAALVNGPLSLVNQNINKPYYTSLVNADTTQLNNKTLSILLADNSFLLELPIKNAQVSATAAIADTKLATISTPGKVSNSATTAASANTASAIVSRDASGNFSAGTITANLVGSSSTITGNLTGDITSTGMVTAITPGIIVDGDINAAAAIAGSKISPVFTGLVVSGPQGFRIAGNTYATNLLPATSQAADVSLRLPATAGLAGQVLTTDGAGSLSFSNAGAGSVTSVGLALPAMFTVSNSPVTLSGTLTAVLANQSSKTVLAGPTDSNPAAPPTFRQLSTEDVSELTNLYHTTSRARTAAVLNNPYGAQTDQSPSVSSVESALSQAQVIYVDRSNTNTYTETGSRARPFKSIATMLSSITDASAGKKYCCIVAPGTYTESPAIRLKPYINMTALAGDTVIITTSDSSRLKWLNSSPGRLFLSGIAFPSGIEVVNDTPLGVSGMVLDIGNSDIGSVIFAGRGGGIDYIQLRNDTRVAGITTINSASVTIFGSTLLGLLTLTDTGCVIPDAYGSAITATLRSNYEFSASVTSATYDVYVDSWGNNPLSSLTMVSNSAVPSTWNTDPGSYPNSVSLSGSPLPVVVLSSSANSVGYTPAVSGNWSPVPTTIGGALDQLAPALRAQDAVGALVADTATAQLDYISGTSFSVTVLPQGLINSVSGIAESGGILSVAPNQATAKTNPIATDILLIADSASSNALKKITLADIVTLAGNGFSDTWVAGTTKIVSHNLGTRNVMVEVFDNVTYETVYVDSVVRTDTNTITLTASSAPSGSGLTVLVKRIA